MQKIAWAYRNYAVALLMVVLPLQARSEEESRSCGRVDLRPKLEANGLRSVRHRGGRTDSASFAVSETLTLALASPLKPLPSGISARSLEHSFNHNDRSLMSELISVRSSTRQRAEFQNSLNSRFCSEEEAPSDDDESVRLARLRLLQQAYESLNLQALGLSGLSPVFELLATKEFYEQNFSPLRCATTLTPKRALRKIKSAKTAPAAAAIDQDLDQGLMPLVVFRSADPFGERLLPIAGRRLSVETGQCEYLLRRYDGPSCEPGTSKFCEEGSTWVLRNDLIEHVSHLWSAR